MKYYIDTEFIEGFHKPLFGKRRHFIDLISIAIVAEDGREYRAISSEYNYREASEFVKNKVLLPLYKDTVHGDARNHIDTTNFHKHFGKPNSVIAKEIIKFVNPGTGNDFAFGVKSEAHKQKFDAYVKLHNIKKFEVTELINGSIQKSNYWLAQPEFYAYFANYDWVLFCSLFGDMNALPKGFPFYCRDLKQMLDEYVQKEWLPASISFMQGTSKNITFDLALEKLKGLDTYPKQENEHLDIDDARWNVKLHKFINQL